MCLNFLMQHYIYLLIDYTKNISFCQSVEYTYMIF